MEVHTPCLREYKELIPIGRMKSNYFHPRFDACQVLTKQSSVLRDYCPDDWLKLSKETEHVYFYDTPTLRTMELAELRIDEERSWPVEDEILKYAVSIVDKILDVPLSCTSYTNDETIEHFREAGSLNKGVGVPLCYMPDVINGAHTRSELIETEWWKNNYDNPLILKTLLNIVKSTPKYQWADMEDFRNEKSRNYFINGFHELYWQIRLFGKGNEMLKKYLWSYYGFNPFMGGTNRMAQGLQFVNEDEHLVNIFRLCFDLAGYDRKLWLKRVSMRRLRLWYRANVNRPDKAQVEKEYIIAQWVADGLVKSFVIMSNGDVVLRIRGNNSGSGLTTTNNIEYGFEMVLDLLCASYYRKYNEFPTQEQLFTVFVALYGDDNIMAIPIDFEYIMDPKFLEDRLLRIHGLKLKVFFGKKQCPMNELTFLGFSFHLKGNFYYPMWNRSRLLLCLTYAEKVRTVEQFLQQFYSIILLSYAHYELNVYLRQLYRDLLQKLLKEEIFGGTPIFKALIRLGVPTDDDLEYFYQGLESGVSRMEVGPQMLNMSDKRVFKNFSLDKNLLLESLSKNLESISRPTKRWMGVIPGLRISESNLYDLNRDQSAMQYSIDELCDLDRSSSEDREDNPKDKEGSFNPYGNEMVVKTCSQCHEIIVFCECKDSVQAFQEGMEDLIYYNPHLEDEIEYCDYHERYMCPCMRDEYILEPQYEYCPIHKSFYCDCFLSENFSWDDFKRQDLCFEALCLRYSALMCGGFNPYGNGQGISKKKFVQKQLAKGVSLAKANAMWAMRKQVNKNSKVNNRGPVKSMPQLPRIPKKKPINKVVNAGYRGMGIETGTAAPNRMNNALAGTELHLSKCVARLILYLANPFLAIGEDPKYTNWWERAYGKDVHMTLPCIPTFPSFPSFKFIALFRGTITVGTAGCAFIAVAPCRPAQDYSTAANSLAPICSSGSVYITTVFPVMDTGAAPAAGVLMQNWTSMYGTADMTTGDKKFRNTFCGVRVSASGPIQTISGDIEHYQSVLHTGLSGADIPTFSNQAGFYTDPVVKGKWFNAVWVHSLPEEYLYKYDVTSTATNPLYIPTTDQLSHHLGIKITGAAVGTVFRTEVVCGFEAIGNTITSKTPSEADVVGLSATQSTFNPDMARIIDKKPSVIDNFVKKVDVSETVNTWVNRGVNFAASYAVNRVGNYLSGPASQPRLMNEANQVYTVEDPPEEVPIRRRFVGDPRMRYVHIHDGEMRQISYSEYRAKRGEVGYYAENKETGHMDKANYDWDVFKEPKVLPDVQREVYHNTGDGRDYYYIDDVYTPVPDSVHPSDEKDLEHGGVTTYEDDRPELKRGIQTPSANKIEVRPEVKISGRPMVNKGGALSNEIRRVPTI